jgi:HK97 family phage portal protein
MDYKAFSLGGKEAKAIVHIPGWAQALDQSTEVTNSQSAFAFVPLVYRAVILRANAISSIPIAVLRKGTELEDGWPFPQHLEDLIWRTEASQLLSGAGYWLRLVNRVKLVGAQWLNPTTMKVELKEGVGTSGERIAELQFVQEVNGKRYGPWGPDRMAYFREFNPSDDIGPGVSAAGVALANAKLHEYATRFAGEFFKGGAMPTVLLPVPMATPELERLRLENWFKRAVTGLSKAMRVLAVKVGEGQEMKPSILTPPIKDMAMPELMQQARTQVALAFGIPQTMLEDAANYATAAEHRLGFWNETVRPRIPLFERVINEQFLAKTDLTIEFRPDELEVFQEDESERASSLNSLTIAGVPLKVAMEILGYDLDEKQWALIPVAKPREPAVVPDKKPEEPVEDEELQKEVRRWERLALKRMREGKPEKMIAFETKVIPGALRGTIEALLEAARTEGEVKGAFQTLKVAHA